MSLDQRDLNTKKAEQGHAADALKRLMSSVRVLSE